MRRNVQLALIAAAGAIAFAQPALAQTAAPDPCKAGPWIALFAADSDVLTPAARKTVDKAAAAYRACGSGSVVISGHTDRKGADSYNVGLSQRMAANVRSYLAAAGVPAGVMTTQAFGESRPAVETPDGKAEPKNRRVEITFGPGSGW